MNYLSGFLLAYLLLPLLKAGAPSRIVNVASLGQHPLDFDDVMLTKGYNGTRAYAQSKLAQIMFTIDLAAELKGVGRYRECAASGHLYKRRWCAKAASRRSPPSSKAVKRSCILRRATMSQAKPGCSSTACGQTQANPQAYDEADHKQLRTLSLELPGLTAARLR